MIIYTTGGRFSTGRLLITPGASKALNHEDVLSAFYRHTRCDWGELCPEDKERNDQALSSGDRLFSSYRASDGTKFWIITEADRSATTILLPHEY